MDIEEMIRAAAQRKAAASNEQAQAAKQTFLTAYGQTFTHEMQTAIRDSLNGYVGMDMTRTWVVQFTYRGTLLTLYAPAAEGASWTLERSNRSVALTDMGGQSNDDDLLLAMAALVEGNA